MSSVHVHHVRVRAFCTQVYNLPKDAHRLYGQYHWLFDVARGKPRPEPVSLDATDTQPPQPSQPSQPSQPPSESSPQPAGAPQPPAAPHSAVPSSARSHARKTPASRDRLKLKRGRKAAAGIAATPSQRSGSSRPLGQVAGVDAATPTPALAREGVLAASAPDNAPAPHSSSAKRCLAADKGKAPTVRCGDASATGNGKEDAAVTVAASTVDDDAPAKAAPPRDAAARSSSRGRHRSSQRSLSQSSNPARSQRHRRRKRGSSAAAQLRSSQQVLGYKETGSPDAPPSQSLGVASTLSQTLLGRSQSEAVGSPATFAGCFGRLGGPREGDGGKAKRGGLLLSSTPTNTAPTNPVAAKAAAAAAAKFRVGLSQSRKPSSRAAAGGAGRATKRRGMSAAGTSSKARPLKSKRGVRSSSGGARRKFKAPRPLSTSQRSTGGTQSKLSTLFASQKALASSSSVVAVASSAGGH